MIIIKYSFIITAILFFLYLCFSYQKYKLIVLAVYLMIITMGYYIHSSKEKKQMNDLIKLSQLIQELIDHKEINGKATLEDSLISKIQHQVIKLSSLLDDHHRTERNERQRLESLIGDIAHQLRTPLSNLKLYIELVDKPLEANAIYYDAISGQTQKLEWLIDALVQLSQLESGCIELQMKSTDLNDTVLNAIGHIHLKAQKKGVNIKYNTVQSILPHDVKWTGEAIYNILDNAVKYSEANSVIKIELIRNELFTKIRISDEGIGISNGEVNDVFKRFYRSPSVHEIEGIGIGLYLSQEILIRQGGYVYAINQPVGSCFEVNLRNN